MKTKILLLLCLVCFGCKNEKRENIRFDPVKWNLRTGEDFPYRDAMLDDDLLKTKILEGLDKDKVHNLLGEPARTDKNFLFYPVSQEKINFFVLHSKTLVLRLAKNETVEAVLIHE